jgi:anaerobic ribonucleoside-triphosphate reductase
MRGEPCMCGADDCPKCFPQNKGLRFCPECGEVMELIDCDEDGGRYACPICDAEDVDDEDNA